MSYLYDYAPYYYSDDEYSVEDTSEYREVSQRLDDATDWFKEIVEILYGKKPFDLNQLENALDEISSYLRVNIPKTHLMVSMTPLNQKNSNP